MAIKEGLRTALNAIRETSIENDTLYHRQIDQILPDTDIGAWASPILESQTVMNEFFDMLVQRIIYTQIESKLFNNPLKMLEGDRMPLGSIGQEIAFNPIKARTFNVDDFAGLLAKYEADVKVQYMHLNSDLQYCVTYTRAKIKDAFTSWDNLNSFIDGITQSLYNGAYIDHYRMTKGLISSAYAGNNVQLRVITEPDDADTAKAFVKYAREMYMNMRFPSSAFNAWNKVGGYGRELLTWTNPEDIVFVIRTDMLALLDVEVLASAFNMDKTTLMGRILPVDNFDEYEGTEKIYDGSNIIGFMGDKAWFRIKEQEMVMDEFYNPNNRTWQVYLNDVRMYQYSLFANGVVFCTEEPTVDVTAMRFANETLSLTDEAVRNTIITTPFNGTVEGLSVVSSDEAVVKVTAGNPLNDKEFTFTPVGSGTATVTATLGNLTATCTVTVTSTP